MPWARGAVGARCRGRARPNSPRPRWSSLSGVPGVAATGRRIRPGAAPARGARSSRCGCAASTSPARSPGSGSDAPRFGRHPAALQKSPGAPAQRAETRSIRWPPKISSSGPARRRRHPVAPSGGPAATGALRAGAAGAAGGLHVLPRIANALAGRENAPAGSPRISKQASRIEARRSSGCAVRVPPGGPIPNTNGPQ